MFKKIFILGQGRVAKECKKIAETFFKIEIQNIIENKNLDFFFSQVKDSLIISANNFYIFKKDCVKNNLIINYHNSLLPNHKGCNANIWTIWENDYKTGITWHKIDENIDTGDIILQKEIVLNDNYTALSLLQKQQKLAISSFEECLFNLKNNFKKHNGGGYHKKYDLPNNGFLDLSWEPMKINRFLRALDNGSLTKKAKIIIDAKEYEILFYELTKNKINITLDNGIIIRI